MFDWYAIFCVRDSEKSIAEVMTCLLSQTVTPKQIIVIDDGSSDDTGKILDSFKYDFDEIVTVIHTDSKTRDYSRIPSLWNMGLRNKWDFHMIMAGDITFENDYAEKLLNEFAKDERLVIASGDFENVFSDTPHGAGRMVRQSFFYNNYKRYPEVIGYESEILFMALFHNKKYKVVNNAKMIHHEKLGGNHNFDEWGWSMRALGYHPLFALARCGLEFFKNGRIGRKGALNMFVKYITYKPNKTGYFSMHEEFMRKGISKYQSDYMKQKIKNILHF